MNFNQLVTLAHLDNVKLAHAIYIAHYNYSTVCNVLKLETNVQHILVCQNNTFVFTVQDHVTSQNISSEVQGIIFSIMISYFIIMYSV